MLKHLTTTQPFWRNATFGVILVMLLSVTAHADDCNELLRLGYTNIHQTVSNHDSIVSAFRSFCQEKYRYASSAIQRQIGASFSFLGFSIGGSTGFGNGTIEETQEQFCDLGYTNSQYRDFESSLSIDIHDRALEAWERCVTLNARGLQTDIRPTADLTAVTVDMYWTGAIAAEFRGIDQPDLGTAVCKVTTAGTPTAVPATAHTRFPLTTQTATVSCTRRFKVTTEATRFTDRLRLTFKTDNGSFDVDMPPLTLRQISHTEINTLYEKISDLENTLQAKTQALENTLLDKMTAGETALSTRLNGVENTVNGKINALSNQMTAGDTALNSRLNIVEEAIRNIWLAIQRLTPVDSGG